MTSVNYLPVIGILALIVAAGMFFFFRSQQKERNALTALLTAHKPPAASNDLPAAAEKPQPARTITSLRKIKRGKQIKIQILDCGPRCGRKGMLVKDKSSGQILKVRRVPTAIKDSLWDNFTVGNGRLAAC